LKAARRFTALGGIALAFALVSGDAGACDSSSCSLVTRGQGGVLAKKAFRIDFSYRYTDDAVFLDGSSAAEHVYRPKVALEQGRIWPEFHRELGGHDSFLQLDLAYGLASRTTLLASVPVLADRSYAIAHAGIQQDYGTTGFGDALVGVRQVIAGSLVGGFSIKLPSARHHIAGDFDGSILDPTLQPGSGSWDFVSTLQYAGTIAPWLVDWSVAGSYQVNTANDLGYRFGDLTVAAASASRTLKGPLAATLQIKFVHEARHTFLGEGVPSTGSSIFYVTPGLRVRLPDQTSLYGIVQLPPYRYVNETQLAVRAAFLVGVSKTF
jgi:hypothetical protein